MELVSSMQRAVVPVMLACLLFAAPGCNKSTAAPATSQPASPDKASIAAALADGKLAGLYIRQRMIPLSIGGRMTFNLTRDYFYFFPDGHVLFAVPTTAGALKECPTAADFAAFKDVPPEQRGTYVVKGGEITMTPEKGNPSTEPFSVPKPGDDGVLQIGPPSIVGSVKAVPFKDGEKLDGAYEFDGTVGLGADNTIFNVKTLTFRPDGTLGSAQLSGVDTKGIQTKAGSSGVTTGGTTTSGGTYKFSEYTLETSIAGKTEKAAAFRWAGDDKPGAPGMICIAGRVYSRQEAK